MKQVAINDIGSAEDFMRAIDESMKKFKNGDLVNGTIVKISREGVLVDIGYKTEGFIPKSELSVRRDFDIHDIVQIGQEVEALVLSLNKEDDQYILSLKDGELENIWNDLQNRYELSIPLVGKVIKMVKGGLIVDIGIKAFLPGSLVEINRVDDFSSYIGQDLEFIINQFDRTKGNVVLNRRTLLEQMIKDEKNIEFAKLAVGQIYQGLVSGVAEYGVFVEIGVLAGLIHKSKMGQIAPESFIVGQEVEVEIIDIDYEKSRLSLAFRG